MTIWQLLTYINWLLVAVCAAIVAYCLVLVNGATHAAGRGLESAIRAGCVLILIGLIGLNLLPYQWSKVVSLLLEILALSLFCYTMMRG